MSPRAEKLWENKCLADYNGEQRRSISKVGACARCGRSTSERTHAQGLGMVCHWCAIKGVAA